MPKTTDHESKTKTQATFAFFGSDDFSILVLEELMRHGLVPELIITGDDKPQGRGMTIVPPEAKVWAMAREIEYVQPSTRNQSFHDYLSKQDWDVFLVASYGKIIPKNILDIPARGSLNIHPSLLPKLRGAAPIQNTILYENKAGISIMLMDELMDHGPIVAQKEVDLAEWPPKKAALEAVLARAGAQLFAEILPDWLTETITATPQDHDNATFTRKITKEDALIDFSDDDEWSYRKIQAFHEWPRSYFFAEKGGKRVRVIITGAHLEDGKLRITKVLPEGKKEMSFDDFLRGNYEMPRS